jgi:outer membrane lipoprotein SlyB
VSTSRGGTLTRGGAWGAVLGLVVGEVIGAILGEVLGDVFGDDVERGNAVWKVWNLSIESDRF